MTGSCAGLLEISSVNPAENRSSEYKVDFSLTQAAGAPEPASLALLGVGLVGLAPVVRGKAGWRPCITGGDTTAG